MIIIKIKIKNMRKGDLYNKMNLNWLNDYNQYILYMVEIINNQSY